MCRIAPKDAVLVEFGGVARMLIHRYTKPKGVRALELSRDLREGEPQCSRASAGTAR